MAPFGWLFLICVMLVWKPCKIPVSSMQATIKQGLQSTSAAVFQADCAASLKNQPKHTKLDEIQEEIQMQSPDAK